MPRNPDKQRCAVPGCHNWARRGTTLCAAHASATPATDAPPLDVNLLRTLLQEPPTDAGPIQKELNYLMALRRVLDEAALAAVAASAPFDLAAHARLQCQISARVQRCLGLPRDDEPLRADELTALVDTVYTDIAQAFPAFAPPDAATT